MHVPMENTMVKRLFAIGLIFAGTSVAWSILAGITSGRTQTADSTLRSHVVRLWGAPQAQIPPAVTATRRVTKKVESLEDKKRIIRTVEEDVTESVGLGSSDVRVGLGLQHRQK